MKIKPTSLEYQPCPTGCGSGTTMNGKPVIFREAKTVLNVKNEAFQEKRLCDGIILNPGDACAYKCSFCYVGAVQRFLAPPLLKAHNLQHGLKHRFEDVVIRKKEVVGILHAQLLDSNGRRRFPNEQDHRIVYSSTTVDVGANMTLVRETAELCMLILEHTGWQIRLLTKGNLLHKMIDDNMIPKRYHHRLIFGVSTGTLDDRVAKAFERGTAFVSKRLESLHWLQDRGLRTFGMICPSLPQEDYDKFSREICSAIRVEKCEHVWAEPINVRGESLGKTLSALLDAGLEADADRLAKVSGPRTAKAWEDYSRETFLAHTRNIPSGKLRFLQYIKPKTADWWAAHIDDGAVLLGKTAKQLGLTATQYISNNSMIKPTGK